MKKTTYTTTRFDVDEEFYVEVSPNKDEEGVTDFVLCKRNYGIKYYMFGLCNEDCPEEMWEGIIKNNIDSCLMVYIRSLEYWDNFPM